MWQAISFVLLVNFLFAAAQNEGGKSIKLPEPVKPNGLHIVPGTEDRFVYSFHASTDDPHADTEHPYIAPGPGDERGPCRMSDSATFSKTPFNCLDVSQRLST